MASSYNKTSTYTRLSASSDHDRPKSSDAKKDLWSSMLDSVASGKRLPEKNVIVLGGSSDSQRDFLEALSVDDGRKQQDRQNNKQPPIANNFALGYTYHDVLDADHEDTLARLSLYLLADPSPSFTPLLRPLLTSDTIPNTLLVILLDWRQPWSWLRQLRDWIRLVQSLLMGLDDHCQERMKEVMTRWQDKGRGNNIPDGSNVIGAAEDDISLPLGPGEWEEALGLPLCVVCQNADQMEVLEKEKSWKEDDFDLVLQVLRTVLLKHGASLIYTTPAVMSPLQTLLHYSLGIQSPLKRQSIRHNLIDRDRVLVPPHWDSWGKIRVLREGFDVEDVSKGWSLDIQEAPLDQPGGVEVAVDKSRGRADDASLHSGAVKTYEAAIRNPSLDAHQSITIEARGLELEASCPDTQTFLASQLDVLDQIRQAAPPSSDNNNQLSTGRQSSHSNLDQGTEYHASEGRVNEHIGPVQFNMGGIQVDADDMLQRLKDRQTFQTPEPTTPGTSSFSSPDGKSQNEALATFFAGLMKRGGGSTSNSPNPAGP